MKAIPENTPVYLWLGVTDMRAGFERLAALVQERMSRSVLSGGVFVFVSRCRRRVKLLYWDNDGYAMWYKRLDAGVFRIQEQDGSEVITEVDLLKLLSGMDLSRILLKKNVEKGLYNAA